MTTSAAIAGLTAPCTLLGTDNINITTQNLLLDGETTLDNVTLYQNTSLSGGFTAIVVPAAHLLVLDLQGATIILTSVVEKDQRYGITFKHYQHALAYLTNHYGFVQADEPSNTTADSFPGSSAIVVPAHLSKHPQLTCPLLITTAFSPFGVNYMSKKQPIRVFLDQDIHSRYLIQAGTHGLTPSALGEKLLHHGVAQLERGDTSPIIAPGSASPAPHCNEA